MNNFRLNWWLERKQLLEKSQFGFRRQKSCTDNLSVFCSEIYNALLQNKPLIGAFLGVKGAYDNVLADVLIKRLQKIQTPRNLLGFIYNLTAERKLNFRINSDIIARLTFQRLSQDSVLNPLLYNLYTAELENFVTNHCHILQFADDIAVYCNTCTLEEGLVAVERTVANLGGHLVDSGLELEPSKCQLIIFNQNKMPCINQFNISINGNTVKSSRKTKFLGVTIQDNLSWGAQVNKVAQACQNGMKIINCLRRTWWGADLKVLMNIYKALIRSRIEYAGFIVNPKEKKLTENLIEYNLKQLERLWDSETLPQIMSYLPRHENPL